MAKTNPLHEPNAKLNFVRRLQRTVKTWQKLAEAPVKHSLKLWQAVASGYYDSGYARTHTINLVDRGVNTMVPFLVEGTPRVMVETKIPEYQPWAFTTKLALNHWLQQERFAERVLIPVARNSLLEPAGITRTSIMHHRNYERQEGVYKLGAPHVAVVDYSNYVGDPSARRREEFIIEGDIYKLPTDYAKEFFGPKFADLIISDGELSHEWSPESILSNNFNKDCLSVRDFTTFIDLYLYDEGIIITILPEGKSSRIINTIEWDGPDGGPYDVLSYKAISENPIGLPPAWAWHDMDVTMNLLVEKMRQQAESQKRIIAVQSTDDATRLREAPNNAILTFEDLQGIQQLDFGGVTPDNYNWISFIESEFSRTGGNADVLGGRAAEAPTLGQEQLLYNNATRIVGSMYNRFQDFSTSVIRKLAWAFWTEPTTYVPVIKEVSGLGSVPVVFADRTKVGEFYDFTFDIQPYSTQREAPEAKFNKVMMFMSQWLLPTIQMAAAQGAQLDINKVNNMMAQYLGLDNFNDWYKTAVPGGLDQLVDYKMMPTERTGLSDAFGASDASRTINSQGQQARAGGMSSPNQQTGRPQV
jgi:hypothetical protein